MKQEDINSLMPTAEQLAEADKGYAAVVLIKGKKKDSGPFYAYVAIPPSKLQAFKEAEIKGSYFIEDFGEIIESGNSENPPAEVIKEMREKYGCDDNYEKDLIKEAERLKAEYDSNQKDQILLAKIAEMKKKKPDSE